MDTYALFDDGSANRVIISFFDSDPGCRIKIDFPPGLSDLQVRNSADEGIYCAYQCLRKLNYITKREDYYLRCRFEEAEVNTKALGSSAGLAFSLKFVQEIYQIKTGKDLNYSVAATGMIVEKGCKAGRVNGINPKLDAAIACLKKGDRFFYPADNEKEINQDIKDSTIQKGIELIPVLTVDEAIQRLLPEKVSTPIEEVPSEVESVQKDQRKLSTIMFTDMVDYSALMQKNEALTLELLEEHRGLLRPIFSIFNGREVETAGDSFLVEFSSALQAAECAVEIQNVLFIRNSEVSIDRQLQIRVGLHLGDIVHKGDEVHGDSVNIASRIETLATPGGISLSEDVYRQIQNKFEHTIKKLGRGELKNIQLPIDIFKVVMPWEPPKSGWKERLLFILKLKKTRRVAIGIAMVILLVVLIIIMIPTDPFPYKKQYEETQKKYLAYLLNKQRFDNLRLFVKSVRGVLVPIHPVRLYTANQPELAAIVEAIREGKTYPDKEENKIVLIAGGPGAGKSPFLKWLACRAEDPEYPSIDGKIAMLDLGRSFRAQNRKDDPECRQEAIPATGTTLEEDLCINSMGISALPRVDDNMLNLNTNATKSLNNLLTRFGFRYGNRCEKKAISPEMSFTAIVVDSLDEVAPSSSKKILELLAAYKKENPAMTIVAAGRGEGFRDYVITNIGSYEYHHLEPIFIGSDRLIEWRVYDWLIYKLIVSGEAKDIPRAEVTANDLKSVEFDKKVKELKYRLDEALKKDPWLRNFLFLLLPSNKLFANLYHHPAKDIRDTWASSILLRSCNTHNRPKNFSDSLRLNLYKKALQETARKMKVTFGNVPSGAFSSSLPIKKPYFILTNLDDVCILPNEETQPCIKVSMIRTLDRSGFVDIFLVDGEQHHVMFFPPVAQEILAEF